MLFKSKMPVEITFLHCWELSYANLVFGLLIWNAKATSPLQAMQFLTMDECDFNWQFYLKNIR